MVIDPIIVLILILTVVNGLIFVNWIYFLIAMLRSIKNSPTLEPQTKIQDTNHKISIIVPARNEEGSLAKCLKSLLDQRCANYEVIVCNDSSTDRTLEIAHEISKGCRNLVVVNTPPKPVDWVGKNWACFQGYLRSSGDILFFTDADTRHSPFALTSALDSMTKENLDALTAIPKLRCNDFLTKVTLPVLSIFLHSRYAPEKVNNPRTKTGYFFGSFYLITKKAYESVGTHKAVRAELVEDGELGRKVKASNFKIKIVRGESHVEAEWARDSKSLWHGLRRLIISLYIKQKGSAILMLIYLFFVMLEPYIGIFVSVELLYLGRSVETLVLLGLTSGCIFLIMLASAFQCKYGLLLRPVYGILSPVGCAAITVSFIISILSIGRRRVSWKNREYDLASLKKAAFS